MIGVERSNHPCIERVVTLLAGRYTWDHSGLFIRVQFKKMMLHLSFDCILPKE